MISRRKVFAFKTFFLLVAAFSVDSSSAQNIVAPDFSGFTANPVMLTDTEVSELTGKTPNLLPPLNAPPDAARITSKLDRHVREFLDGAPWMPYHHTLGISGYEASFAHPDEVFYTLSIALPFLNGETMRRVREFLTAELHTNPPYGAPGYEFRTGRPRESYDVPLRLRREGRHQAADLFGIYAFWAFTYFSGDTNAAQAHWPAIKARLRPLLTGRYAFDPLARSDGKGAAERLNGDLAGLIGGIRLARANGDSERERQARTRCRELLEHRLNLDRTNPTLLEPSNAASRSLHHAKLARFCRLVPELAEAIATGTDQCAARNVKRFREKRNAWFLAYGDRFVGGENYTNPIHFPWSLFTAAALIEQLPSPELASFVDVPWCRGDLYFMQTCVLALWAADGRPWQNL